MGSFPEHQLCDISVGGDAAWRAAADAVAATAHPTHSLSGEVDAYILSALILYALAESTGRREQGVQELRNALSAGAHTVYTLLHQAMPGEDVLRALEADEGWRYRARHWPIVKADVRRGHDDLDRYDPHILALTDLTDLTDLTGMPHRRPAGHQGPDRWGFSQAFGMLSGWFGIAARP